ncbi:MAG: hypothetical protein ACKOYN_05885 [Planctomycetota bacterium]
MFFAIATTLVAAFLAGTCILGVMASRIDNAQRFASLVARTRELRAARHRAQPAPRPARR